MVPVTAEKEKFVLVRSAEQIGFVFNCPQSKRFLRSGEYMIGINTETESYCLGLKPKPCPYCGDYHRLPEVFKTEALAKNFYEIFSAADTNKSEDVKYILVITDLSIVGELLD